MVLSAFSCELLLKCLIAMQGQPVEPTHRLDVLFRKLHPNTKRRIDALWEAECRPAADALCRQFGKPSDLPNALVMCGKAFENLRYAFEDPSKVVFYLGDLPRVLYNVILEMRPDWDPNIQGTSPIP